MKKNLQIQYKNGDSYWTVSNHFETKAKLILLADLGIDLQEPLLISIRHEELNTHLECTGLPGYYLLSGDQDGLVTGISIISPSGRGTFGIITQAKEILLIPVFTALNLKEISKFK